MRNAVHIFVATLLTVGIVFAGGEKEGYAPLRGSTGLAVCIGLGSYPQQGDLRGAESDAVAMASALHRNGYRVICLTSEDATITQVRAALDRAPTIVYFAGHFRSSQLQLKDGGLAITDVARNTRFMLLDCCHAGQDLEDEGATIVFAAGSGYVYEAGRHGLFTRHLLDWLSIAPARRTQRMVDYVCRNVARETGNWQRPVVGRL